MKSMIYKEYLHSSGLPGTCHNALWLPGAPPPAAGCVLTASGRPPRMDGLAPALTGAPSWRGFLEMASSYCTWKSAHLYATYVTHMDFNKRTSERLEL